MWQGAVSASSRLVDRERPREGEREGQRKTRPDPQQRKAQPPGRVWLDPSVDDFWKEKASRGDRVATLWDFGIQGGESNLLTASVRECNAAGAACMHYLLDDGTWFRNRAGAGGLGLQTFSFPFPEFGNCPWRIPRRGGEFGNVGMDRVFLPLP
jgi:hypothetical protein